MHTSTDVTGTLPDEFLLVIGEFVDAPPDAGSVSKAGDGYGVIGGAQTGEGCTYATSHNGVK
jgi:hypothetical protein